MEKMTKKELGTGILVFVLIFIAWLSRLPSFAYLNPGGVTRGVIYLTLYIFWGISLYSRLNHPQVRRYMIAIAGLMVFWFVFRIIKFGFSDSLPALSRYMWYLYYLPMLFIPFLAMLVSFSIGIPEESRLPKKTAFLYLPAAVLFLMTLTNDLHQLVFTFPADASVWTDSDYGYAFGYGLIVIYLVVCAFTILGTLSVKCRLPRNRRRIVLPCLPILILMAYMVLNFLRVDWLYYIAGDMTAVFCLMYAATLELCIRCGLIQTNTGYADLFKVSRLGAQITNQQNRVCLANPNAMALTKEQILSVQSHPVFPDNNTLLKSNAIRFGHVLWQEDITELAEAIEQIEENCRNLEERNRIRRENLETKKKILTLQEKNRTIDLLHRETASQIDLIDQMLTQVDEERDENERNRLLAGVTVIGSYVKRYGNLLLVNERTKTVDIRDLARCFDESFANLELLGAKCLYSLPSDICLNTEDMLRIYRTFETVVEACLYDLSHVWINTRENGEKLLLSMEFVCDTDLSSLSLKADGFSHEDGSWRFTFHLQKGGERK